MLAWKAATCLAMEHGGIETCPEYTSLTALLFCAISVCAGWLAKGVVNIVTGDGAVGRDDCAIGCRKDRLYWIKRPWAGISASDSRERQGLTLEWGARSPYIVFDDADLISGRRGGWSTSILGSSGSVCCAARALLVHEPVAESVLCQACACHRRSCAVGKYPLDKIALKRWRAGRSRSRAVA